MRETGSCLHPPIRKTQRLVVFLIALCLLSFWKNLFSPLRTFHAHNHAFPSHHSEAPASAVDNALTQFSAPSDSRNNNETIKEIDSEEENSMAACLLVMDDNHFLIEWLAYHYHVLPLRHLIVAVDPRSKTSPAPILQRWQKRNHGMTIAEWHDQDYITDADRQEAEYWAQRKFGDIPRALIQHRARQRLFYYHCMRRFKEQGRQWTLLTDSDEFLRVNYRTVTQKLLREPGDNNHGIRVPPMTESGSVLTYLRQELKRPGHNLTSACVQIPRIRFGAHEPPPPPTGSTEPQPSFNISAFQTLRWHQHAKAGNFPVNRISKVLVDLRRVSWTDLEPVESIHLPIKSLCKRRRLHIRAHEQVLVLNHYLGTWEQYSYREDSRTGNERSRMVDSVCVRVYSFLICKASSWTSGLVFLVCWLKFFRIDSSCCVSLKQQAYQKAARLDQETDDAIVPWLEGFVREQGHDTALELLEGVGRLETKPSTLGRL